MELFGIDIFRFFNFFLIFFVFVYIFRKYILPDINLVIAEKESGEKKIYARQCTLEDTLFALTTDVAREKLLYEQLQQKIIMWKTVVGQKNDENKHIEELLCKRLETRHNEQAQKRETDLILRKEIHNVVVMLISDVNKKYSDQRNNETFQQMILSHMEINEHKKQNGL